jgi:hypothetical protein
VQTFGERNMRVAFLNSIRNRKHSMRRDDISDDLVHFIRGNDFEEALGTLQTIVKEARLLGGNGYIKGGYRCVCLSEAPLHQLGSVLNKPTVRGVRYRPFGVVVSKTWLYSQGGRPVIYQHDSEFSGLSDQMRWRHVRYEPSTEPLIDFSWEREWRIHTDSLPINPKVARIVVPNEEWFQRLRDRHDREQTHNAEMWSVVIGDLAWGYVEAFPWTTEFLDRIAA